MLHLYGSLHCMEQLVYINWSGFVCFVGFVGFDGFVRFYNSFYFKFAFPNKIIDFLINLIQIDPALTSSPN